MNFEPTILKVSQLNYYAKTLLEGDPKLAYVFVTGEISNLKNHYASGHIYCSLKDESAVISAVMFKGNARNLKFTPENGTKVIARGRVSIYEATGQYQLYIEDMQPDGIGALTLAFEQLKKRLEEQGLFDPAHKKELPRYPKTLGIITAKSGAALQDMINVATRRFSGIKILVYPAIVQGEFAVPTLIEGVEYFSKTHAADVVIIGRGGGTIEDLWAFNSEGLARAVYNCSVPIISAVGHETDFTICDFVADLRAPTPSAAAELCIPEAAVLMSNAFDFLYKAEVALKNIFNKNHEALNRHEAAIYKVNPAATLANKEDNINSIFTSIAKDFKAKLAANFAQVEYYEKVFASLDPTNILARGFAAVYLQEGTQATQKKQLNSGENIKITFSDGTATATVT
ncbi:MAG: exodeoxyribonuclease VII large subunit [Oscillospiraceae bacterium]|jgi:exodeoxyribonuclease VII large subunit|nr:exodeoxyribonuclease VII large subunit [Oscillospiraceae bacterium]